ncbi:carbohydrate esterase family 1 protein [Xylaria sp. CBS 124048]|nr:carbohydrate esterase family 1 protein [Xylaria sp. CBS 124048]
MSFEIKATIKTFGGKLLKLAHQSTTTRTPMNVSVYLPPQAIANPTNNNPTQTKIPVLIYLSGLTCTPDNCVEKGFLHASASKHGIAIIYPDTSPRGTTLLPGEDANWDFGRGAGFYVDATREPWRENYRMYSYIRHELLDALFAPETAATTFGGGAVLDRQRISIAGHSMGGHGALTLYLKNPGLFRSVSAFAPICNPGRCPWGVKAFTGYFGGEDGDRRAWAEHDATVLVGGEEWKGKELRALIDVGTGDKFYHDGQLLPENFEKAVEGNEVRGVTVRYQEGYDHSYFFISTFAQDHVEHAAKYLL